MTVPVSIRPASTDDAAQITAIYNPYVLETTISFEEQPVSASEMVSRILAVQAEGLPWLVAEQGGQIVGYAYATPWRGRTAYRHSVETTVYLTRTVCGQGVGRRLYEQLLATLSAGGKRAVIGGIALPNAASIALHEGLGFKPVARFEQVGYKAGRWVDVGYWQLLLDAA
ncbi:arsinothricin resistance N-acetyltransferase ArsN1 family B [Chitinimonas sp. BJYL2]|uniref:arsinothricin resistance N-acetyltransferase ArsN1 family B n=1 Tax=Chitinimonas sp. BJYL2 TaxID=2976696 RepID=UPI0022B4D3F2|nr:arsinothricin resistance N-acetyltransferase ArsN1 family B [Chitinimonas sp. BJYL2]